MDGGCSASLKGRAIVGDTPDADVKACSLGVTDGPWGVNAGMRSPEGPGIGGESTKRGADGSEAEPSTSCLIGTDGEDGTDESFGVSVQLRQCRRILLLTLNVFLHLLQA